MTFQHYSGSSSNSNGNGAARSVVRGASLVHRTMTKSQLAVIVADVGDGIRAYQPTQSELARLLGVSSSMVQRAKRLSPLARRHVMSGRVTLGYYAKPVAPKTAIKIAINPGDPAKQDDEALRAIIKRRGVDHVVDVAAAIEAAQ